MARCVRHRSYGEPTVVLLVQPERDDRDTYAEYLSHMGLAPLCVQEATDALRLAARVDEASVVDRAADARSSSICEVRPHVEDQGAADQREADTRRHARDQYRERTNPADDERSTPCDTPRTLAAMRGLRAGPAPAPADVECTLGAYQCGVVGP